MDIKPKYGDVQVNASEYASGIVIERFGYYNEPQPSWGVPAWEEWGYPELAGPFDTVEQAYRALKKAAAA